MNKNVLITGISRGIGKSICEKFVEKGYHVYGTYFTGKSEANKLKERIGNISLIGPYNFSVNNDTKKLLEDIKNVEFDSVILNAGKLSLDEDDNVHHDFNNFDLDMFEEVMNCNFYAPLIISTGLKNQICKGGSIVIIASTDGLQGTYATLSYSASKAALINLAESLSNNYGMRGVRVNTIAPGWISTDMDTEPSLKAGLLTPLGRNGKPHEVADLAFYLSSKEASFINGSLVKIDGGYTNADIIYKEEADGIALIPNSLIEKG